MHKRLIFFLAVAHCLFLNTNAQSIASYKNPIISGFYPDPSICRVGKDYYLATSSFQYWPGIPVFHSTDLVNWKQIGYCITRKSQADLIHVGSSDGLWAPTIRYHKGIYYMIVSQVNRSHWKAVNFYVTANNPAGPWSDPLIVDSDKGIDPDLFFDDNDKCYYSRNDGKGIVVAELDIKTGKLLSDYHTLWAGTGAPYPEAPHLYKKDGNYYLLIAEGGTGPYHRASIARSKDVLGGYKSNIDNPILQHTSRFMHPIQATGHGDLLEAHDGSWWLVFLAKRSNEFESFNSVLGRETFLAPVVWTADGWPIVGNRGHVEMEMPAPAFCMEKQVNHSFRDDFNDSQMKQEWNYLRYPTEKNYSIDAQKGTLLLRGDTLSLDHLLSPTFIGYRQKDFDFVATTALQFINAQEGDEAGLSVYMEETNHYEISIVRLNNSNYLRVQGRIGLLKGLIAEKEINSDKVFLRIEGDKKHYHFLYSVDNKNFMPLGKLECKYLESPQYTGAYLALYATGNGKPAMAKAIFDYFEYHQK